MGGHVEALLFLAARPVPLVVGRALCEHAIDVALVQSFNDRVERGFVGFCGHGDTS